jgi:hypothetical protein
MNIQGMSKEEQREAELRIADIARQRQIGPERHWPGPWIDSPKMSDAIIAAPGGYVHPADTDYYGGSLIAESVAGYNKPIIKAAPDLLVALEELMGWLAYGLEKPDGAEPTAEDVERCERVTAQARRAIDRARGLMP